MGGGGSKRIDPGLGYERETRQETTKKKKKEEDDDEWKP